MVEWYENLPESWDWTRRDPRERLHAGFIVFCDPAFCEQGLDTEPESPQFLRGIASEATTVSKADSAEAQVIDPFVGAGSFALEVMLVLSSAASAITIGEALHRHGPALVRATGWFSSHFADENDPARVVYSAEVLQVLVVSEVCETENVSPAKITEVGCIMHSASPAEPCEWLKPTDAAYTITVGGFLEDHYYHVWNYVVTCWGHVVSSLTFSVPRANATHWYSEQRPKRMLRGVPASNQ